MPVSFYVDPDLINNLESKNVTSVTLSYTFYEIDLPETASYFKNNKDKILVEVTDIMVSDLLTLLSKINIKKTGFSKNEDYVNCLKNCYSDVTGDMVAIEFKVI